MPYKKILGNLCNQNQNIVINSLKKLDNNVENFNVYKVYQYHEWSDMWKDLSKRLSIDIDMEKTETIRFKDSKKPFAHYSHAYKDNEQELVDQLCEQEIKYFGYNL